MSKYDRYERENYNDDFDESYVIAASPEDIEKWDSESYAIVIKVIFVVLTVVITAFGTWKFFN